MNLTRRTLFAAVLAPLASRFAPKAAVVRPSSLAALDAYAMEHIVPHLTDVVYRSTPLYARLNSRDNSCFRGGGSLA